MDDKVEMVGEMDGWTKGWMNGGTDGWMMDKGIDGDEEMVGWTKGLTDQWTNDNKIAVLLLLLFIIIT